MGPSNFQLGSPLFEAVFVEGTLTIYHLGFTLRNSRSELAVRFNDLSSIHSCLNGQIFSEAGRSGNLHQLLPLEIYYKADVLILSVDLQIYSRLMILLIELWRDVRAVEEHKLKTN